MGRAPKDVDINAMLDMMAEGLTDKEIAGQLGVTVPTIKDRIDKLQKEDSNLLAYDKVRHLDLLQVQERIVANVTDDKLAQAPLQHLATAYVAFNKVEQLITGRPTEIHGLMGYLLHLEKEDINAKSSMDNGDVVDVDPVQLSLFEADNG